MREVYYHEDDYCQLELVAESNSQWCAEQMGQIDEFAAAHKEEVGWTDIYVRSSNPMPLCSMNISRSGFTKSMPSSMPRFDRVFTGYSSFRSECKSTIAFGPHDSLVAYAEFDNNDVILSVWFTLDLRSTDDVEIANDLASCLSRWAVLLADWGWSQLIRLTDRDKLVHYYLDRVNVFGRGQT